MKENGAILVVDDDEDIAANYVDILTSHGYLADAANDGESALKLARGRKYDLALLDYKMPDMDGATLFEKIKFLRPELRAIMITAHTGCDGVERARRAGIDHVLRKPVDLPLFFSVLGELHNINDSKSS